MKLSTLMKIDMWVSPLTHNIYIGETRIDRHGKKVAKDDKVDVTDAVISAVAQHLGESECEYEFQHGYLRFVPKEVKKDA